MKLIEMKRLLDPEVKSDGVPPIAIAMMTIGVLSILAGLVLFPVMWREGYDLYGYPAYAASAVI